jgi:glucose/arabinose dehydrogenase
MRFKLFVAQFIVLILLNIATAQFQLETAFPSLTFVRPVDLQHANDQSNRLFVVEQAGIIKVFQNDSQVSSAGEFLNITGRVDDGGNEEGLLGLAFHPDYQNNGYFYVNYTANQPNRTVISRFSVSSANPDLADPNSELVLLEFSQPHSNHNGGQIAFGPSDGYLYIATGDGGSFGDPDCNAQDLTTLLGAILRIDVDTTSGNLAYGIPPDNPFINNSNGFREEIFAYGLRNPWRFSFDPERGQLWAADVGQNAWEEIDLIINGGNYGWSIFEGNHCYNSPWPCNPPCDSTGLIMPVWEYDHSLGQSITGGFVYRGQTVPELIGKYIYADYVSGRIWALEHDTSGTVQNSELINSSLLISSFGIDENRELYICAFDGKIYRFQPTVNSIKGENTNPPSNFLLGQNYPNPFNGQTVIPIYLSKDADISLVIHDVSGKKIETIFEKSASVGEHHINWDPSGVSKSPMASGLYFYQLLVDGVPVDQRQMHYIK